MSQQTFYHALQVDEDQCIACARCMKSCPTEAIRVVDGHATISEHRCVDCGNCFKVCPVKAIYIKHDDFDRIFDYKCRVALVPAVFLGQFAEDIPASRVYSVLKEIGFTHVFEVESAVQIFAQAKNQYALEGLGEKPLISSFCPAIVRLIQVRFPSLVDNIIPVKAPVDIVAKYAYKTLVERGVPRKDIGLFYISPCAAKVAAVKSPVGEEKSMVDGIINMDELYNRVQKKMKELGKNYTVPGFSMARLSSDAVLSTLTNGERRLCIANRSLAIDEIHNVTEFLEKVENEEIEDIEFLELRACDQSCAGGVLLCQNRFLISECMYARARKIAERERNGEITNDSKLDAERDFLLSDVRVSAVKPRSMLALDEDVSKALEKMEKIQKIKAKLPQIDCGVCGSPSCNALAEDIVCRDASLERCVFMNNAQNHEMKDIWGEEKFSE